jgi:hypothetical protein
MVRESDVLSSPGTGVVFHTGDLLMAVGTQEGLDTAADILHNGLSHGPVGPDPHRTAGCCVLPGPIGQTDRDVAHPLYLLGGLVATRRMRSVPATYRKLLDDAEKLSLLRDELKWLAGVLGEARDAEVMQTRLKGMVAEEPEELVTGPVTRRVDLELGGAYQEAHGNALPLPSWHGSCPWTVSQPSCGLEKHPA